MTTLQKILGIAKSDPDAFDIDRVILEGAEYICNPRGYSEELDRLCDEYEREEKP